MCKFELSFHRQVMGLNPKGEKGLEDTMPDT